MNCPANINCDPRNASCVCRQVTRFDYTNQAWIVNGVYERCGHPEEMDCQCFGKLHAGEPAQQGAGIA